MLPTLRKAFGLVDFDKADLGSAAEAEVKSLDLNREARTLEVSASFSRPLSFAELRGLQTQIQRAYTLRSVEITPVYGEFDLGFVPCIIDCAVKDDPIAGSVLSDCGVSVESGKLVVNLRGKGSEFLENVVREMELILRRWFKTAMKVVIVEGAEEAAESPYPAEDSVCSYSWEAPVVEDRGFEPPPPVSAPEPPPQAPKPEFKSNFSKRPPRPRAPVVPEEDIYFGKSFGEEPIKMSEIDSDVGEVAVCGEVFAVETKDTRSGRQRIISADMTDKTGSVRIKRIVAIENSDELLKNLVVGAYIKVRGEMEQDTFYGDRVLKFFDIVRADKPERKDTCSEKRVELHMHTTMSQMDAVSTATSLISRAKSWGHKAIAVTDHGVTQAFPEALKAGKGIKILYGCEAYFSTATTESFAVVGQSNEPVDGEYVCFDLETTGTDVKKERITEIGACIVTNGARGETFHTYVDPEKPISPFITKLTGISDATVAGAPKDEEAIRA
ncbi:MAG: PHP domain-containing protein, partial [Oscillospiraceae bacterium]|nr:PHP domain-containing protein [Oscillospiraceae bacterium]